MSKFASLLSLMLISAMPTAAQEPKWAIEGPFIERPSVSFDVPLLLSGTKVYLEVEVAGKKRRFVVDTGSPSMIDTALANELGLPVVGKSQGTDSHGVIIESDIVQADLTLGGVTFHKVPMFSADFSTSQVTRHFIGDGVLGSEMLPLGAWQVDRRGSVLRFSTDVKKLPFVDRAKRLKLHDLGYPHLPILDVRFAKRAVSKAMFDTGSPAYFAISPADLEGAEKAGGIGRSNSGMGSAGASLGGQAPNMQQLQVELKKLSIGGLKLGRVGAVRRQSSPSLIGAGFLEHFVVTLDSRSGWAYFERNPGDKRSAKKDSPRSFARSSFGFTLAFDQRITVALVWDGSPAHKAGLRPGLHLTAINGEATELSSDGIRRALEALAGQEVEVAWPGGSTKLVHKVHILQD